MRLIDADSLKEDLLTFFPPTVRIGLTANTMLNQILNDIDNQPTVDPVKHGHWIHVEDDLLDYYKTSCCGTATMWMCDRTNYCPNCGAKMDEENDQ